MAVAAAQKRAEAAAAPDLAAGSFDETTVTAPLEGAAGMAAAADADMMMELRGTVGPSIARLTSQPSLQVGQCSLQGLQGCTSEDLN